MIGVVLKFLSGQEPDKIADKTAFILVHINLVVYAMCFWMQNPVLPFLSKELGAEGIWFGFLQSTVSIFSLIGGPIFGQIIDTKGAKYSLILAQASSLVMYALTAVSFSLPILYLSRIPAIGQHAMLCSQAGIALVLDKSSRATAMGRISLSYGVGMVVGGPLGGMLSENFGMRSSAFISAACSLIMILVMVGFYPNSPFESEEAKKKSEGLSLKVIKDMLMIRTLRDVLATNFFYSFGMGAFRTAFTLAAIDSFGFTTQSLGMYVSFAAVVSLVGNVFFVPALLSFFKKDYLNIFLFCCIASLFSFMFFTSVYNFYSVCIVSIPLTLAQGAMYVISTSLISSAVDSSKQGTAISLSHALRSFVGLLAPVTGGYLYEQFKLYGVCVFVGFCILLSAFYSQTVAKESFKKASANSHVE